MVINADARDIPLRDESVQLVVTSPPYWGLRDYGTGHWEGGVPFCDHGDGYRKGRADYAIKEYADDPTFAARKASANKMGFGVKTECSCGARWVDPAIGLEETLELFVQEVVRVFREVHRVLRRDGLIFVNMGDSYYGSGRGEGRNPDNTTDKQLSNIGSIGLKRSTIPKGLKKGDLMGMPWRIALALQSDGWTLRSDIIWHKPNPMPESFSVRRCTNNHEYLFMLSKNGMGYYWDAEAIKEPAVPDRKSCGRGYQRMKGKSFIDREGREVKADENWNMKTSKEGMGVRGNESWAKYTIGQGKGPEYKNRRDVWTITVEHGGESHYATFPEELALPCILAGSKPGDLIFDPFLGSGTIGRVATRTGRRWVGTELSWEYCRIAQRRNAQMGLFA